MGLPVILLLLALTYLPLGGGAYGKGLRDALGKTGSDVRKLCDETGMAGSTKEGLDLKDLLERHGAGCRSEILMRRLKGGSSLQGALSEGPHLQEFLEREGLAQMFTSVELEGLRARFLEDGSEKVPVRLLTDLRILITKRRDKLSRALITGGELSQSSEEAKDESIMHFASAAKQSKAKQKSVSSSRNSASGIDEVTEPSMKRSKHGLAVNGLPTENCGDPSGRKRHRTGSPSGVSRADKGFIDHLARDMLNYNPSLKEEDGNDVFADAQHNRTYLGWSQSRMTVQATKVGKCDLVLSDGCVRVVSAVGVEVGEMRRSSRECMEKLLKHLAPPITIEASLASGVLEMLFYGPKSSLPALQGLLSKYNMPYKPSSVEQPKTGGKKIDREKEEIQLAGVISGGGSMQDLLEDHGMHDDMQELMGPPSVKTALLEVGSTCSSHT